MATIISQNDKKIALEREKAELRSKLLIAEAELNRKESSEKVADSLEQELEKIRNEIVIISKERDELLEQVASLHQRLRQVDNTAGMTRLTLEQRKEYDDVEGEEERLSKNREAYLNVMLLKAKQEKVKAVKLIINLLGKETVQRLLRSDSASPQAKSSLSPSPATNRRSFSQSFYSSPNVFTTPIDPSKRRSPTRTNSLFAEELVNGDLSLSPIPNSSFGGSGNNTTIGNDLLDRLIDALSSPRTRKSMK